MGSKFRRDAKTSLKRSNSPKQDLAQFVSLGNGQLVYICIFVIITIARMIIMMMKRRVGRVEYVKQFKPMGNLSQKFTSKLSKLQLIFFVEIGLILDICSYNLGKMYRCMGSIYPNQMRNFQYLLSISELSVYVTLKDFTPDLQRHFATMQGVGMDKKPELIWRPTGGRC